MSFLNFSPGANRHSAARRKSRQQAPPHRTSPRPFHLLIERLEDRCVPSNFTYAALDVPGSAFTFANAINDSGQIVGNYSYGAAGQNLGFLYSGGSYTTLYVPGSQYTIASGINNAGQIVGGYFGDTNGHVGFHGFLYSGGSYTTIDFMGGIPGQSFDADTILTGINNVGQIVGDWGYSGGPNGPPVRPTIAFLYNLGSNTVANDFNGFGSQTFPLDINDAGQIVGIFDDGNRGFLGFLFPYPNGPTFTQSGRLWYGINNAGQVVGQYIGAGGQSFLERGITTGVTTTIPLQVPGSQGTFAFGINNVDQIVGGYVDASGAHGFLATPGLDLTVIAKFDQHLSQNLFGPYLPGVNFDVPFNITASDPTHKVSSVKWQVAGGTSGTASPGASPSTWTFTYNVGSLTAADHTLTVSALDSTDKTLDSFTGALRVTKLPINFDVKAAYPGGSANEVQDLRFITSIPLSEKFTGTIGGIPSYYQYARFPLQVLLNNAPVAATTTNIGNDLGFEFTMDAGTLKARISQLYASLGSILLDQLASNPNQVFPQPVTAVKEPTWLQTVTPSFDTTKGAYDFNHVELPITLKLPTPNVQTGIGWIDSQLHGLQTFASLTPDLDVVVPLLVKQPATVSVNFLTVSAQLLGQNVWNDIYTSSDLNVVGILDSQKLTPIDLSVALNAPVVLLDRTIFDKTFQVHLIGASPLVDVTASVRATLATSLTADAGIEVSWVNNQLMLVPSGTFVSLEATATATFTVAADADFIGGWVTITATASIQATIVVDGQANFGGSLGSPVISSSNLSASLSGEYGYSVFGDEASTGVIIDEENSTPFGPIELN